MVVVSEEHLVEDIHQLPGVCQQKVIKQEKIKELMTSLLDEEVVGSKLCQDH
jgi:hypothetical protein